MQFVDHIRENIAQGKFIVALYMDIPESVWHSQSYLFPYPIME